MVRSFIALSLGCGLARGAVFNTQSFGSSETSDDQNLGFAQASEYDDYFDYANFDLEESDEEKVSFEESEAEDYYDYELDDDEAEEAEDESFDMTNIEGVDNSSQFSPNPNNFDPNSQTFLTFFKEQMKKMYLLMRQQQSYGNNNLPNMAGMYSDVSNSYGSPASNSLFNNGFLARSANAGRNNKNKNNQDARAIVTPAVCRGKADPCEDVDGYCSADPVDPAQYVCICNGGLSWSRETNTCNGCSITDDSFLNIIDSYLTPNNAQVATFAQVNATKSKVGDCTDESITYPEGHKCRIACFDGYRVPPLEAGDEPIPGSKFFKCSCNSGDCRWSYGGKVVKTDGWGNPLPKEEWKKHQNIIRCEDQNDPEIFRAMLESNQIRMDRQLARAEKKAEREAEKAERTGNREAIKAANREKWESKRAERSAPVGIQFMHSIGVPVVRSFTSDFVARVAGWHKVFGKTPIVVMQGLPVVEFDQFIVFINQLTDYLRSQGIPLAYHTTMGTGPNAESAKYTAFLYNPMIVEPLETFPAEGEEDPGDFTYLPVGVMFQRVNKKVGWVRRFTILSYNAPLETSTVKTEVLKLSKFVYDNLEKFGNNTIISGDYRLNCFDWHYNNPIAQGMSTVESDEFLAQPEISEAFRWETYGTRTKQPDMRYKRYCSQFGTMVFKSRKMNDICHDADIGVWHGRGSWNVFKYLEVNMVPLACHVN